MVATLTKGHTFGSTDQLTHTLAHAMVDGATISNIDRTNFDNSSASPVHLASSAPSGANAGNTWYDTTNAILRMYDGNTWQPVARGYVYTNRSGSSVAAGDVVIRDTANANAVKKTTTANDSKVFGVCLHAASDVAEVVVITEGRCPAVTVSGSTAIGNYLFTSTSGGVASPSATIGAGVFGRALTTSASSVVAHIGGASLIAGGSPSSSRYDGVAVITGTRATDAASGSVTYAHGLSVAPRDIAAFGHVSGVTFRAALGQSYNVSGTTFKNGGIGYDVVAAIFRGSTTTCLGYYESGSVYQIGAVSAVDTTNVTITWTKAGSTASRTLSFVLVVAG